MALLQMLQQPQAKDDSKQIMKMLAMFAAAGGGGAGTPGAGTPPPPSMEGMMPPTGPSAGMMPPAQGASMMQPSPQMGPPTQLQGLMNPPANNLGLAPQGSPVMPPSAQIAMQQQPQTVNGIPVINESTKFENTGSTYKYTPDTTEQKMEKIAGVLGSAGDNQPQAPQMQPLSRGAPMQMQMPESPLIGGTQQGAYQQMLAKMISGMYG